MRIKLLKQHNIPKLGALVDSFQTSLPFVSVINALSIITVLYVTVHEYLSVWMPWLTFWLFVSIMVLGIIVLMVVVYKFILPSIWTFRNKQMNLFESDILREIQKLQKEIREVRK